MNSDASWLNWPPSLRRPVSRRASFGMRPLLRARFQMSRRDSRSPWLNMRRVSSTTSRIHTAPAALMAKRSSRPSWAAVTGSEWGLTSPGLRARLIMRTSSQASRRRASSSLRSRGGLVRRPAWGQPSPRQVTTIAPPACQGCASSRTRSTGLRRAGGSVKFLGGNGHAAHATAVGSVRSKISANFGQGPNAIGDGQVGMRASLRQGGNPRPWFRPCARELMPGTAMTTHRRPGDVPRRARLGDNRATRRRP